MKKFKLRNKNQSDETGPVDPLELDILASNFDIEPETMLVPVPPQGVEQKLTTSERNARDSEQPEQTKKHSEPIN